MNTQSQSLFVPEDFVVPATLIGDDFRLRMLTVNDVVRDFDAVVSSAEHLKALAPGSTWPEGLTLEQNLIDLGWHQKEFQRRGSFAYTVVSPSDTRVLGCVYIYPSSRRGHDAEIYLWARQSELAGGLEKRLYEAVREWIASEWPFHSVAYPGRSVDWPAWHAIPRGEV